MEKAEQMKHKYTMNERRLGVCEIWYYIRVSHWWNSYWGRLCSVYLCVECNCFVDEFSLNGDS